MPSLRTMSLFLCCLVLAGFVACGGDETEGDQAPAASEDADAGAGGSEQAADLQAALKNAATAQEVHITSTGTYTDSVDDLVAEGAAIPPGVELVVAVVDRGRYYCIEALAEDGSAVMSIESGGLPAEGPCEPGAAN